MCIIRICSDNMWMTSTYTNNSSRNEMYITCACVETICTETKLWIIGYMRSVRDDKQMTCTCADNMQMTWTICVCVDNVWKLSCG